MADYYSILAKAVNALDPNTGMARQQLYQRARSAMISELENVYPPFRRSEIATAEIALESAIEKAEAEAVRCGNLGRLDHPVKSGALWVDFR